VENGNGRPLEQHSEQVFREGDEGNGGSKSQNAAADVLFRLMLH
jgi:hypothetical protein